MKRRLNSRKDKKVFRNSARKTRAVNVYPSTSRGGIRL